MAALSFGLSLPKFSLFPCGFFFLIPLLYLIHSGRVKKAFGLFFSFSFLSYLFILYWIPHVMVQYGGTSTFLGIIGLVALAAFLSLFNGLAGSLILRTPLYMVPFIWVTKDLVIEHIFGGFPWCQAGYSQFQNLYFIQMAEWGGIHLITFLLIGFNVLLYLLLLRRTKATLIALLVAFIGVYSTGFFLYKVNAKQLQEFPVQHAGIIQPNTNNDYVPMDEKIDILNRLFTESQDLVKQGATFILWPEHTVSLYPLQDPELLTFFSQFNKTGAPLLAGFTDRQDYEHIFNSYILFDKQGIQKYDKVHLAPFGEYVLFRKWLFFIKKITDEIGDFTPGERTQNLKVNNHLMATPICYEVIFPELVREFVNQGAQVIVTGSNDSWFGDTSAPFQHLAMAVIRSVENRRYILRSTTNGISGVISPAGQIVQRLPRHTPQHVLAPFRYLSQITIFTSWGYLFPYGCLLIVIIFIVYFRFFHVIDRDRHKAV